MSPHGGKRLGAGRRPLPFSERRVIQVRLSVTIGEAKQLERLADQADERVPAYLYRLVHAHLARRRRGAK